MRSWRQDHLSIHCWHYVVFLHYAENQPLVHSPLSLQKLFYEPLPLHLTSCICHTDSCRFWLVPPCLTKQLLLRPSHTSNCMHCVLPVCQLPQILPWPHLSCAVGDHFACVGNNAQSDSFPCYDDNFQMVDNFLFYWYVPCHRVAVQLVLHCWHHWSRHGRYISSIHLTYVWCCLQFCSSSGLFACMSFLF